MRKHPMQRVVFDEHGVARFVKNEIVVRLLDLGRFDMNGIALQGFSKEDREQFAQLVGYSVSGFGDLSYASRSTVRLADRAVKRLTKARKK